MLLIGFGNKSRNGKDTAAEAIKNFYDLQTANRRKHVPSYRGPNVGIFKFAGALYAEVNEFLRTTTKMGTWQDCWLPNATNTGAIDIYLERHIQIPEWVQPDPNPEVSTLAPYGKHPKLLQFWGTEYRRNNFGQDYWINKMFESIPANTDIALVTDVRFPNEADAIKQHGGYNINVTRLNDDGTQFYDTQRPQDHISEIALDNYNWDHYIKVRNDAVLLQELAITHAEYLKARHK